VQQGRISGGGESSNSLSDTVVPYPTKQSKLIMNSSLQQFNGIHVIHAQSGTTIPVNN